MPVDASRLTAPAGITAHALAVGVHAPDIDLPDLVNGKAGRFHLANALAHKQRVVLVFYRGDW